MQFYKFFFDNETDCPAADSPRTILARPGVDAILTQIALAPVGALTLSSLRHAHDPTLVTALCHVGALTVDHETVQFACPVFLASDYDALYQLSCTTADLVVAQLAAHQASLRAITANLHNGFPAERNLYHLLCGCIFDGTYFDRLAKQAFVTVEKPHPSGLDYLIILYEDTPVLNHWSRRLLCSYNRYGTETGTFASFGDADGTRHDFYRAAQMSDPALQGLSRAQLVAAYLALLRNETVSSGTMEIFERFGYATDGRSCVPVFNWSKDQAVLDALSALVFELTEPAIIAALSRISAADLTANRHGVPVPDIANEVFHLIFGQVNEALVASGLVAAPDAIPNEGRYLRAFEVA